MHLTNQDIVAASCPVCHYTLAAPLFDGGQQPLATLGWPRSSDEARSMARYPLDYVGCPRCTHVWNRSFTYDAIPYANNPNRMFNQGTIWQGHLQQTRDIALSRLPRSPTVIDIGCGEGHFVRGLSEALGGRGRFIGYDPNTTAESGVGVEFHARYFDPLTDVPALAPDLLVMRHVLEHLTDSAAFVDQLAWGAARSDKAVMLFAEMPCVDRALSSGRLVDFYYEHPSQFTSQSFRTLMERAGSILHLDHGYDGEVIHALVALRVPDAYRSNRDQAAAFRAEAGVGRSAIREQLKALVRAGKRIAIWGGTGKAAAFMHYFDANAEDCPLVVDSDPDKVGTFVPKTGQEIQSRDALLERAVDVIIIPSQWRALDIADEMARAGIAASRILIEHDGRLVDFLDGSHPYRRQQPG